MSGLPRSLKEANWADIIEVVSCFRRFGVSILFDNASFSQAQSLEEVYLQNLPEEHQKCHRLLLSEPLSDPSLYVSDGSCSQTGDLAMGRTLIGIRCSGEEITVCMQHYDFEHLGTENWPALTGPSWAPFNKRISFCAPPISWLNRLRRYRCEVVAYCSLLKGQIFRIPSAATK